MAESMASRVGKLTVVWLSCQVSEPVWVDCR